MSPHHRPSAARRLGVALSLSTSLLGGPALAGPADTDEPLIHPRLEGDPRLDTDERTLVPSPLRAPVWIGLGFSLRRERLALSLDRESDRDRLSFGAMLLLGLPLERLHAREVRAGGLAEATSPPTPPPPPRQEPMPPRPPPAPPATPPPLVLRIPVVISPDAARAAVNEALRHARLVDPDARIDAMIARARGSAGLPELRLRALRSVDQGQALAPTEYDPTRTTATTGSSFWLEARATWRLDRLVFTEEELSLERMRHERREARAKLTSRVLKLLFEWQRALALVESDVTSPEENLAARLKAIEAEAEIDLLTDGWLSRFRAR